VERITFENAHSSRITEMTQGAPTRASATMTRTKSRARFQPGNETQSGGTGDETNPPSDQGGIGRSGSDDSGAVDDNAPDTDE
jgi:hypothetical protein